jgi:hypothetical protein
MAIVSPSEFKAPPRQASGKTAAKVAAQKQADTAAKTGSREEAINGVFQLGHFGLILARQYADAGALSMHGPAVSHEVAELANTNEKIAKTVDYFLEAGPYAGLITALMPLALQIMVNHKLVKAEHVAGGGVVTPEALAAQTKAAMLRQAQEAIQAQRDAEAELRAMAAQNEPEDGAQDQPEPSSNGSGATMGSQTV